MRKRIISAMIVLCMTFSIFGLFAYANSDTTTNIISQDDAAKIALLFIANTIHEDRTTNWDEDTELETIVEMYNLNDEVNSYTFDLKNNDEPNGYVVVSANTDLGIILEYSDVAEPMYKDFDSEYEKIIYTAPLEYYLSIEEDIFEIGSKKTGKYNRKGSRENSSNQQRKVDRKDLKDNFNRNRNDKQSNRNFVNNIRNTVEDDVVDIFLGRSSYSGQVDGYVTNSNVHSYVNDRYGSGWSLESSSTVSNAGSPLLMNSFPGNSNHCTITALTYVFDYHRRNSGKTNIPNNINTLFNDIKDIATSHGYTPSGGTPFWNVSNIINDVWDEYNHSGSGNSVYAFTQNTFKNEVDNNRPALLNITAGHYGYHTVTMVGYRVYSKSTWYGSSERLFLRVYDGWTTNTRYIDYNAITSFTSGDYSTLSISRVIP